MRLPWLLLWLFLPSALLAAEPVAERALRGRCRIRAGRGAGRRGEIFTPFLLSPQDNSGTSGFRRSCR
mgnify:CR=1 FL=1